MALLGRGLLEGASGHQASGHFEIVEKSAPTKRPIGGELQF